MIILRNLLDVTVYMIDDAKDEIYPVTRSTKENRITYKIGDGTTVASYVAFHKEFVKINDLLEDVRFPEGLGSSGKYLLFHSFSIHKYY